MPTNTVSFYDLFVLKWYYVNSSFDFFFLLLSFVSRFEMMVECWSYESANRPTFQQIHDRLTTFQTQYMTNEILEQFESTNRRLLSEVGDLLYFLLRLFLLLLFMIFFIISSVSWHAHAFRVNNFDQSLSSKLVKLAFGKLLLSVF